MSLLKISYSAIRCDGLRFLHLPQSERPYSHYITAIDSDNNHINFVLHKSDGGIHFRLQNETLSPKDFISAEMVNGNKYCIGRGTKGKSKKPVIVRFIETDSSSLHKDLELIYDIIDCVISEPLHFTYGDNEEKKEFIKYKHIM